MSGYIVPAESTPELHRKPVALPNTLQGIRPGQLGAPLRPNCGPELGGQAARHRTLPVIFFPSVVCVDRHTRPV